MKYHNRLIKFFAVGVLNTLFGYSVYVLCIWIGLHYSAAAAVSTTLGVIFNFKSIGILVFGYRDNSKIFKFVSVYGFIYIVNVICLGALTFLGLDAYLAGAILILPLACLSYYLNNRFVFI